VCAGEAAAIRDEHAGVDIDASVLDRDENLHELLRWLTAISQSARDAGAASSA
jgi:hypothetical protein